MRPYSIQTVQALASDAYGNFDWNVAFGEKMVGNRIADVSFGFQYNLNEKFLKPPVTAGLGSAVVDNFAGTLSSGSGIGSALVQSRRSIRYRPGFNGIADFTAAFTLNHGNSTQRIGPFDTHDGFALSVLNGALAVSRRRETVWSEIYAPDFKVLRERKSDISCWLDLEDLNIYRVIYGFLGIAPIQFFVYGGTQRGWVPFAEIDLTNQQRMTHIGNPTLPISAYVETTAGTTPVELITGSWNGSVVGPIDLTDNPQNAGFGRQSTRTISANTRTNLITLIPQENFQGVPNHVRTLLKAITASAEGTKPVAINIWKNATLSAPNPVAHSADKSTCFVDTSASVVSGGEFEYALELSKTGNDSQIIEALDIDAVYGETLTISAISTNQSEIRTTVRWQEEF